MKRVHLIKLISSAILLSLLLLACQPATEEGGSQTAADTQSDAVEPTPMPPPDTPEPEPTDTPPPPRPTATEEIMETATAAPTETATPAPTETPTPTEQPAVLRTYEIVPGRSEARFFIDEVLLGSPNTVVGRTGLVNGQLLAEINRPAEAQVGPIQIDARDLTTDNNFRNQAIRGRILNSSQDEYQYIFFTPNAIEGLAEEPAVVGQPVTFNISGDLQIRDISNPVTFAMTVTVNSETELSGFGVATVQRSDFDLRIPSVASVAEVSEEVRLEIEFVALATEE